MKNIFALLLLLPALAFAESYDEPFTFYVAPNGNDAWRGSETSPKLTISNAVNSARPGDTVRVKSGTYRENNLLRQGVHIFGDVGANLFYSQTTTNDAGYGIFDDRYCGATTNLIVWPGSIVMIALTNMAFYDTVTDDGTFPFNLNTVGAIVLTNSASKVTFKNCGLLSYSGLSLEVAAAAAIFAEKGRHTFEFEMVTNLLSGVSFTAGSSGAFATHMTALETGDADVFAKFKTLFGGTYAWLWHSTNHNVTNDVYITVDNVIGQMYGDSASDNARGWVRGFELNTAGVGNGQGLGAFGSGKWYFYFDKVKSDGTAVKTALGASNTKSNAVIWLTCPKLEPGTLFAEAAAGEIYLTTQQPNGSHATGMVTSGNGRIFPHYGVSGSTNLSASASSVTVQLRPPMLSTNYSPSLRFGFNSGTTNVWYSALTRSNFTANFAPVAGGGVAFFEAKQNAQ